MVAAANKRVTAMMNFASSWGHVPPFGLENGFLPFRHSSTTAFSKPI
jgi:hypothetical protein